MEFREFGNPESVDYDIKSSLNNYQPISTPPVSDYYGDKLMELVGLLMDGEWLEYGITEGEYMNPTAETILKVERHLKETSTHTR